MWEDEVLEEIHRLREEHARAFNYDIKAICDDLRHKQTLRKMEVVSAPAKVPNRRVFSDKKS